MRLGIETPFGEREAGTFEVIGPLANSRMGSSPEWRDSMVERGFANSVARTIRRKLDDDQGARLALLQHYQGTKSNRPYCDRISQPNCRVPCSKRIKP
jgi:hypothetical protein